MYTLSFIGNRSQADREAESPLSLSLPLVFTFADIELPLPGSTCRQRTSNWTRTCAAKSPVVFGMMSHGLVDHFPLTFIFGSRTLIHGALVVAGFGPQFLPGGEARRIELAGFELCLTRSSARPRARSPAPVHAGRASRTLSRDGGAWMASPSAFCDGRLCLRSSIKHNEPSSTTVRPRRASAMGATDSCPQRDRVPHQRFCLGGGAMPFRPGVPLVPGHFCRVTRNVPSTSEPRDYILDRNRYETQTPWSCPSLS